MPRMRPCRPAAPKSFLEHVCEQKNPARVGPSQIGRTAGPCFLKRGDTRAAAMKEQNHTASAHRENPAIRVIIEGKIHKMAAEGDNINPRRGDPHPAPPAPTRSSGCVRPTVGQMSCEPAICPGGELAYMKPNVCHE